jgi:hypothetical protein
MRHHGFSCSSLYTVTPEQAQENLLIDTVKILASGAVSLYSANRKKSGDCAWNPNIRAKQASTHVVEAAMPVGDGHENIIA